MRETADTLVLARLQEQIERWLLAVAEPDNARRLQSALAHVAQLGMELGFRADPDAERLYELVAWLEERHGRLPVLQRVGEHMSATEATFLRALESIVADLGQVPTSEASQEAARQMHEMRDVAAAQLLDLLCGLAALESGEEPPTDSSEAGVLFYEATELPDAFRDLAARAAGLPGAFHAVRDEREPSLLQRLRGKERDEDVSAESGGRRGLTKFVPSFDDPHLRFLTLSHLFFLQSYLTRNLVEALPELLEQAKLLDE